jgi:predicted phosphohydrolase
VYGDQGTNKYSELAVQRAIEYEPSLHLHVGDLSYGGARISQWVKWFNIIEPLASTIPYMYAIGNHEYDGAGDLSDLRAFFEAPNDELSYTFRWSNVFFLTVNLGPSSGKPPSSDIINWVDEQLNRASNDPSIDWIVVFIHYPPYSSGKSHGSSPAAEALIPLFDEYGVDLVFAGHEHNYERTYPIKDGKVVSTNSSTYVDIDGTIYLVVGGAGGGLYKEFITPKPDWSFYRVAEYSIGVVIVNGRSIEVKAINSVTGEVMDSFKIRKTEKPSLIEEGILIGSDDMRVFLIVLLISLSTYISLRKTIHASSNDAIRDN